MRARKLWTADSLPPRSPHGDPEGSADEIDALWETITTSHALPMTPRKLSVDIAWLGEPDPTRRHPTLNRASRGDIVMVFFLIVKH